MFKANKLFFAKILKYVSFILFFSAFLIIPCFAYDYYAAGKHAYKKNDYSKASYYLSKALEKFPDNTKCRYYYAQTLINLKNFEKAQSEYEKVIEKAPLSYEAKLASLGISKIQRYRLIKKGRLKPAAKNRGISGQKLRIKSVGDNYIQNAIDSGKVTRWHQGKMPVKLYIERSSNVEGYKDYYYAAAQKAMNDWTGSVDGNLLSYELVTNPREADIQLYFVREILENTGKAFIAGLATPHIKQHLLYYYDVKVVTQKPPDGRSFTEKEIYRTILHELGHALGIRGHSSQKRDIMYAGVETNPQHEDRGLSERDINTLTLLYTLDPDISNFSKNEKPVADSGRNKKVLGSQEERLKNKLQEAVKYTEKYPDNVLSWVQLGKAYHDLKKYTQAVSSLNKALKIDPSYPSAIETLAFVYKDTGNFAGACGQFEKLIKLQPSNISFSHNYALYLIKNKKYDRAKEVLYNLRAINPRAYGNSDVKNLMDYLSTVN